MDRAGIQTSYSSITVPGIYFAEGFGNQQAPPGAKFKNDVPALAREANEFGARMKSDYPGRFGIWASLPLPDVDASLKEIEYIGREIGQDPKAFASRAQQPRLLSFLRRFYYDTAATSNFLQMQNLKTLVGLNQVVLGADHPYGDPLDYILDLRDLQASGVLTAQERQNIERENVAKLLAAAKT